MFNGIKKIVIKARIKAFLNDPLFVESVLGGLRSTGGKFGELCRKYYTYGTTGIVDPIQEADSDKLSTLLAELAIPSIKIFDALKDMTKIIKEDEEFIKSIGGGILEALGKYDNEMEESVDGIHKDSKDIQDVAINLFKKHIMKDEEEKEIEVK